MVCFQSIEPVCLPHPGKPGPLRPDRLGVHLHRWPDLSGFTTRLPECREELRMQSPDGVALIGRFHAFQCKLANGFEHGVAGFAAWHTSLPEEAAVNERGDAIDDVQW